MIKSTTKICIAYCGHLVDNGTMDVRNLGPALIAFGNLISECNKVLNHDDSEIAVNVNADFQKGSFEIQLELIRSVFAQVQSMFGDTAFTMENISSALGIVVNGGIIGGGLLGLLKWLKGRKIEKATDNKDGTVTIHVEGEHLTIKQPVINIYQSVPVRESIQKVLDPVKLDGIDSFEVRDVRKKDDRIVSRIDKNEIVYFDITDHLEPITNVSTQEVLVKILSLSFEENNKWRLLLGTDKIYANIADETFVKQVKDSIISFTNGDTLKVLLEITQTIEQDSSIKNTYRVLKVIDVIKRPKQISLNFEE
jgi:hypothetical protein